MLRERAPAPTLFEVLVMRPDAGRLGDALGHLPVREEVLSEASPHPTSR